MKERYRKVIVTVTAFVAIVMFGFVTMAGLSAMRTPPQEVEIAEPALRVRAQEVVPDNVPVTLVETGVARSLDVVEIATEVSGKCVAVHPRLEEGEIIPKGETLFVIDPRNYEARVNVVKAEISQLESTITRIKTEWENDRRRLKTLQRSRDLARAEFERIKRLHEEDGFEALSRVDQAEQNYNAAQDTVDQLERSLSVYPIRINETESMLDAARANLAQAEADLERTTVTAPFNARVKEVRVEEGQFVGPGNSVLALADDSVLEVSVALDSRDVRRWLPFADTIRPADTAWFGEVEAVTCIVRWTEDPENHNWKGVLDRVERFENDTRKVTVAVRVDAASAVRPLSGALPLVDGMFCKVEIPGKTMENVYKLPQWAVSYEGDVEAGEVFVSVNDRLQRRPVSILRRAEDFVYVQEGLRPGDVVITTRLVDPLENSLLEIEELEAAES